MNPICKSVIIIYTHVAEKIWISFYSESFCGNVNLQQMMEINSEINTSFGV
jgi:hypothetical protein